MVLEITSMTLKNNNYCTQQGIAKSGAERLRLDIRARFNICSSIKLLC